MQTLAYSQSAGVYGGSFYLPVQILRVTRAWCAQS